MKKLLILLLLFGVTKIYAIGNGDIVSDNNWLAKSVVAIVYKVGATNEICTGSILSRKHILTAAHCFKTKKSKMKNLSNFKILLGTDVTAYVMGLKEENNVKEFEIEKVELYSSSIDFSVPGDLAVLKLKKSLPSKYLTIKLANSDLNSDGDQAQLISTGYGLVSSGGSSFGTNLRQGTFHNSPIPLNDLNEYFSIEKNDNYFIHLSSNEGQSTCSGDSGGPTFQQINGKWFQVGITHGSTNRNEAYLSAYRCPNEETYITKVAPFLDWINNLVKTL